MKLSARDETRKGVALVVSLVILVLLAVMAVALLQSSGLERGSSKSVAEKADADLNAQTAVNAAMAQLVDNLKQYPDSQTGWEAVNDSSGNLQYQGTVLYYRSQTPETLNTTLPSTSPTPPLYVLPLISGATAQPTPSTATTNEQARIAALRGALPTLDDTNSYNFNRARSAGDLQGWIGSSPQWLNSSTAPTTPQPFRGQWINLVDSTGKTVGRYAYWMEDESFKGNVNLMGNKARGSDTLGESFDQVPFQGVLKSVLGGTGNYDSAADDVTTYRSKFPASKFFNFRDLNQVSGQQTLADTVKFEATLYSGTNNISRSGSRRVNLNKVVTTTTDATEIRKELDEIINTITYHLPNFAQRFYRTGTGSDKNSTDVSNSGSPTHRTIYLNKLAANIRDYIDTDSQPTIVNNDLSVNIGSRPSHSLPAGGASSTNSVIAIGKEHVPFIQEYMLRVKQIQPSTRVSSSKNFITTNYKIEIDHYIEVWNMSDRDITVAELGGSSAFLEIANQPGWNSNGGTDIPEGRTFSIPLDQFKNSSGQSLVFAAGAATVLTTDPAALPSTIPLADSSKLFKPSAGTPVDSNRVYSGTCGNLGRPASGAAPSLDMITRPTQGSSQGDDETEIILGNDSGILESFGAPVAWYITIDSSQNPPRTDTSNYFFRACSLKGNGSGFSPTVSQVGDPRTNNEQIALSSASTVSDDQTTYKTELGRNQPAIGNSDPPSLTALNSKYVSPSGWTDPSSDTATDATHAPAVVANAPITSIAELGNVFDPVRKVGVSGSILYSRGGGRTLRIGQPDDLWDGNSGSPSREWAAWRLADIFTSNDFPQLVGRININGMNRDGGAAFKAALYGYNFRVAPDSDPIIASQALTDPQLAALVSQMQLRLGNQSPFDKTSGPFAEFGELSEMPVFNSGNQLTGQDMSKIYDRGREEILRRISELITTRGNTFTVYAVGQSLVPQSGTATPIVTSSAQLKVIFRIDLVGPTFNSGSTPDPFNPTDSSRFAKPTGYAIKILYAGD